LGNYKAQRCVGSAYESARGIVEDLSEAYTWYATALENRIADKADEQDEADQDV
jgi:TPR repeat protein